MISEAQVLETLPIMGDDQALKKQIVRTVVALAREVDKLRALQEANR